MALFVDGTDSLLRLKFYLSRDIQYIIFKDWLMFVSLFTNSTIVSNTPVLCPYVVNVTLWKYLFFFLTLSVYHGAEVNETVWTLSVEEVVIIWETSLVVQPTFQLLSREETNYQPFFHGAMIDSSFRLCALLFRCLARSMNY